MSDQKKNPLDALKERFNPNAMMANMAKEMLPGLEKKFVEKLEAMEKPESEGGKLSDGAEKICYSAVAVNGKLQISIHALKREGENMMMSKPFTSFPLSELLKLSNNGKSEEK